LGGVASGRVVAGVIGGACALLVTMADVGTTRASRVSTMAAAAVAMIAGGTIGAKLGGSTYADEAVVLLAALIAGWVSASHPGIAAVARFGAVATATGAGLQFADPAIALAAAAGGVMAIAAAFAAWWAFGLPPEENSIDWRAGIRRALAGAGAGPRFAIAFALACATALLAAEWLGVSRPYWATITVMLVMRREGTVSLQLVVHYMVGTLAGILLAAPISGAGAPPIITALIAAAFAALARLGLALNPALGFTAFTAFFMLAIDLALAAAGIETHLLAARLYDVAVGCGLTLIGLLAARPRRPSPQLA